ncbi:MAG: AAA family ATPase [Candidatus Omnitrophica bacterium]|nr:AAA family ATPase [Candidatus Omnitrophota bacterium]MBU0896690.1 AAA family ATPase [Candidatus Omnitrophota bacterium]MBU1134071.1 AAA family ATPase [Candidatus Omnitrophota bacterium]MBU1366706.1 AAA family ATPase [Candidatus Omnitrophota bacterium]MBU1524456.1 AAA family ATPase [Candidatus Omnitrophota bacterium]
MYLEFYGLTKSPFNITSDPGFFYESKSHKEALAALLFGIRERKGIILITGEVGTGKTTLCKTLLNRLPPEVKTSLIFNPYFSEAQLLQAIVEDFSLESGKKSRLDMVKRLNTFLVDISLAGGNAVLIIDEAQNLTNRQLEQVRLLSNLETSNEKLLQIILVGQPELEEKLSQFRLRQIRQRIFVKHKLSPLEEKEVEDYISFRLKKTGKDGIKILPESFKIIYEFSAGIPRLVNMLCDRALLLGFVKEKRIFDREIFTACVEELK